MSMEMVGMAFAVATSRFCQQMVLGIWWRGLTDSGATAGVLARGGAAIATVLLTVAGVGAPGWIGVLIIQPAAWTVPLAFTVMVVVSLATRHRLPPTVSTTMLRLHAPDALRL